MMRRNDVGSVRLFGCLYHCLIFPSMLDLFYSIMTLKLSCWLNAEVLQLAAGLSRLLEQNAELTPN